MDSSKRKIKNYLQLTNKIFIVYNSKNENKIGYFKTELVEAIAPKYFDDKNKMFVKPEKYDFHVTSQDAQAWAPKIFENIKKIL